jgi:hypothetical protein
MLAEHAAYVSWTRAIVAILLLFFGSDLSLGQGPVSDATGQHAAQATAGAAATDSPRLAADVEQAIRWLPEDTESIIVARGPLEDGILKDFRGPPPAPAVSVNPAPPPAPNDGHGPFYPPTSSGNPPRPPAGGNGSATLAPSLATVDIAQEPERDFRQEMLGSSLQLFGLAGEAFAQNIAKHRIHFVVSAARRFGLPVIGRASTYQGCELIVFDNAVPDVALKAREQEKLSVELIENNRVVRIDTDVEWGDKDEKLSIWYAKPKPNILIAATDAGVVKTILQRMARPTAASSPLLNFPEWKYVDTKSSVWGIRHRRTVAPIYMVAKAWKNTLPPSALSGVTFSYQPLPTASVAYRLHFTEGVKDILPKVVADDTGMKLVAPTVAERRVSFPRRSDSNGRSSETPWETSFWIRHIMGYIVCP